MTLDEIEERVKISLEALNGQFENYDWRLTHYNTPAWANLQEGCYFLSEGKIEEVTLKELIKIFRDRSLISYIDFRIKVPEPGVDDFRRMNVLFGPLDPDARLLPPRDTDTRKAYLHAKILSSMRLAMENKHVISEKLKQQMMWLMVREKDKTPEMLAINLKFGEYNAYHKKLAPGPTVILMNHEIEQTKEEQTAAPAPAPTTAPMFAASFTDNSSFEARFAAAPVKAPRTAKPKQASYNHNPGEFLVVTPAPAPEAPHELPTVIHEEFALYCNNLYEKAKGN